MITLGDKLGAPKKKGKLKKRRLSPRAVGPSVEPVNPQPRPSLPLAEPEPRGKNKKDGILRFRPENKSALEYCNYRITKSRSIPIISQTSSKPALCWALKKY